MATWEDVRRRALALPGTSERTSGGTLQWRVRDRLFVWERPLRRPDLAALGDAAPAGAVLGVRVADEGVKQALVASEPWAFTTPHFDGYPVVLLELAAVPEEALEELVVEAWRDRAGPRLVRELDGG